MVLNVHIWWHKCVEISSTVSDASEISRTVCDVRAVLYCFFFSLLNFAFIKTFKISFHFYSFGILVLAAVALRGPQTMQLCYFLGEINQIGNQLLHVGWLVNYAKVLFTCHIK